LRILYRKKYLLKVRKCIPLINRIGRGYLGRAKVKAIRAHIKAQAKRKAERNQRRAERKAEGLEYDDSDLDTVTMQDEDDDDESLNSNDDSLQSQSKNYEVISKTGKK
jgi:phosphopantothenoylcysteine synthetase/decarboxylase